MDLLVILRDVFGHQQFKSQQQAIINHVINGGNALVLMPTGMGKSLCYQLPARVLGGLTVVVSPLIALMRDQVKKARSLGLRVAEIHSGLTKEQREKNIERLKRGEFELLYVTPERFRKVEFREALAPLTVKLLAIDEAHCITQWGHDFRPDYSKVSEIRNWLKNPTTIALTATATPLVQTEIIKSLGLTESTCRIFNDGLERPNIALNVHEVYGWDEKIRGVLAFRHSISGPIIVYGSLISNLEKLSRELQRLGVKSLIYHSQIPEKYRHRSQQEFQHSDSALMLATPAFGLGVDKSNVRGVIHVEVPSSLEAYFQEVGRAGRDGHSSEGHLLWDKDDVLIQEDFMKWANPDPDFYRGVYQLLRDNPDRVKAQGLDYLREQMNYFNSRDFRLETALNMMERYEVIEWPNRGRDITVIGDLPSDLLDKSHYQNKIKSAQMRLWQMVSFAESDKCRSKMIYEYFGRQQVEKCGTCDNCRKASNAPA